MPLLTHLLQQLLVCQTGMCRREPVCEPHIPAEALAMVRLADGLSLHILHAVVCATHARIGSRRCGHPFAPVFLDHAARVVDMVCMLIEYGVDIERWHAFVAYITRQYSCSIEYVRQYAEAQGVVVGTQHGLVHVPVVGDALIGGGEFPERLSGGIARIAALCHGHHRLWREVPAARHPIVLPHLHAYRVRRHAVIQRHAVLADAGP